MAVAEGDLGRAEELFKKGLAIATTETVDVMALTIGAENKAKTYYAMFGFFQPEGTRNERYSFERYLSLKKKREEAAGPLSVTLTILTPGIPTLQPITDLYTVKHMLVDGKNHTYLLKQEIRNNLHDIEMLR